MSRWARELAYELYPLGYMVHMAEGLDILNEFCLWGIYSWQQQQTAYKKTYKNEEAKNTRSPCSERVANTLPVKSFYGPLFNLWLNTFQQQTVKAAERQGAPVTQLKQHQHQHQHHQQQNVATATNSVAIRRRQHQHNVFMAVLMGGAGAGPEAGLRPGASKPSSRYQMKY